MCGIFGLLQYGSYLPEKTIKECVEKLSNRGPDKMHIVDVSLESVKILDIVESEQKWKSIPARLTMGFTRLSIMDITDNGVQPFEMDGSYVCCNGEIYNWETLKPDHMVSTCDCEVLLPTYHNSESFQEFIGKLDAEFALFLYDKEREYLHVARDIYGVRPLFWGFNNKTKMIGFASELKALHDIMEVVMPLNPSMSCCIDLTQYDGTVSNLICFEKIYDLELLKKDSILISESYLKEKIRDYFTEAVKKRLHADREIGFLLSGGLDSSLIVAIATKILGPDNIVCFSVGLEGSPDVVAAKKVAEFLKIKNHHIVPFDIETGIKNIPEVIKTIETYDITTIRASTPQYIMAKYITEKTKIRVLLSGEGSDEIHGSYKYFRAAPNSIEFHNETIRLMSELYLFDCLRTDRTMSGNGLEVRVPFLDFNYVRFIKSIDPALLMYSQTRMEKTLIRDSFIGYLPYEILYRPKEAFSDAVSNTETNWFKSIQKVASSEISDQELSDCKITHNKPLITEAYYYRKIFDKIYPGRETVLPHFWLPRFQSTVITDPSATVLTC